MFIIDCAKENSHCKVEDFEVRYDPDNVPEPGELVNFYWNNKEYQGTVIMHSDDENEIDAKFDELTKKSHKSRKTNKDDKTIVSPKNTLSRKRRTSGPEQKSSDAPASKKPKTLSNKKLKKSAQDPEQTSQVYIQEHLKKSLHPKSTATNRQVIKSPSKQELKKKLEKIQAQLEAVADKTHYKKPSKPRGSSPITESPDDSSELEDILSDTDLKSPCSSNENFDSPTTKQNSIKDQTIIKKENESENNSGTKLKDGTENDKDDIELKGKKESVGEDTDKSKTKGSGKELNKKDESEDKIDPMNEKKYAEDEKNNDPDFYDEDDQLFGPDHKMKMINIGDGIYCTEYRWNLAQSSREGTIMIRHLMDGIFRHEKILDCTFTGQPPRNRPINSDEKFYLHTKATQCIINLILKRAEENGWKKKTKHGFVSYTWKILQQAMSQRLCKIKRTKSENSKLQPKKSA